MLSDHCMHENHDLCGGALLAGDLHRRACTCSCHNLKGRAPSPEDQALNDLLDNVHLTNSPLRRAA